MFGWFRKFFNGDTVEAIINAIEPDIDETIQREKANVKQISEDKHPDFESMSKADIAAYAEEKGFKLDRRKSKEKMIIELINHLNKEK